MIVDAIVGGFLAGLDALFSLLPTISFFANSTVGFVLPSEMNHIFPFTFLVGTVLVCIAIRIGMQGWDFAVYVYHQFWGSD